MKSASERQGSLPSLFACWRRKWNRVEDFFACVVGVELDVVADGAGGKEAVDAACGDQIFLDDVIEESVGIGEELARLLALLFVLEDARVDAFESPGVEERRPVDEFAQRGERKVVEHADAGECGCGQVFGAPLDRSAPGAGGLEGDDGLARRGVGLAERLVFGAMLGDELGFAIVAEEAGRDGHGAAGVEHVDHGLAVVRRDLDGGVTRLVVAPPMSSGSLKPWRSISRATCTISSRDGVMRPLRPIMSTFSALARSRIFSQETMTPMSMTS